jgi:hypothetical protein
VSDDEMPSQHHLRIVRDGDDNNHRSPKISPEQAKSMFMASPHLEWSTWAKSMGWRTSTPKYPNFSDWQREKRDILARDQAESISEALFSHRGRWHADVLKTLKEYPEAPDAMMGIFKKRINDIIQTINEDERHRALAAQTGEQFVSNFAKIETAELRNIAAGLKLVTEAKHKALMIDGWNIKVAESFTDPAQFEAPNLENQQWKVQLLGGHEIDENGMKQLMKSYYDVPGVEIGVNGNDGLETT